MTAGGVLLVVAAGGGWPPDFAAWQPTDWTALAAGVTATTAVVAGTVALLQLRHARALRREQAQPYVVAYMDTWGPDPRFVDIVIRNFGSTLARDVRITMTPSPQQAIAGEDPEDVWLPDSIPALVPGQEWRTLWGFAPSRVDSDLPARHDVLIDYNDSHGRPLPSTPSVLDWAAHQGRQFVTTYGLHEAAKALREINQTTQKWTNSPRGGLAVFSRNGDAVDERERTERAQRQENHRKLRGRLLPPAEDDQMNTEQGL